MAKEAELWEIVAKNQLQNNEKADIIVFTALLRINNLKFLNDAKIGVLDIFKDEDTFMKFCQPFLELQSSLAMCSSIEGDLINLQNAVFKGFVDEDLRCPTTKTINRYISYCNNNDKDGFLYSLESYIRGSAANNRNLIFNADNIDYFDVSEQDTLEILINEETEKELEEIGEKEEEETPQASLFDDLEIKNLRKAGNKFPLKKAKKEQDTGSLFDLGGAA
ncbi:hypothetical protein JXM83_07045 [Candidatus Woesearchaeota archaeon]|nr:hypothetical protein [Candidatus Woesearchaeota archaeon]